MHNPAPAAAHVPAAHEVQLPALEAMVKADAVPATQAVQEVALPPDQYPAPHCTGFEEADAHWYPAGHAPQLDAAAAVE